MVAPRVLVVLLIVAASLAIEAPKNKPIPKKPSDVPAPSKKTGKTADLTTDESFGFGYLGPPLRRYYYPYLYLRYPSPYYKYGGWPYQGYGGYRGYGGGYGGYGGGYGGWGHGGGYGGGYGGWPYYGYGYKGYPYRGYGHQWPYYG